MKRAFGFIFIIQLLISLFFITAIIPNDASAPQIVPTVSLSLQEASQTAHVGPGDTGEVTFEGVVSVTCNPLTRVVVSLTVEDTWGSSVVSPASLLFSVSGEKSFTVSVRAPEGESCYTCGTVTVTGRWAMYPSGISGPCNSAIGRIDIAHYHNLLLSSLNSYTQTAHGSSVTFELAIENEGNGNESLTFMVNNIENLTANGLQASIDSTNLEIPQNQKKAVNIYVNTFTGTTGGTHEIIIGIFPEIWEGEEEVSFEYIFIVELPYTSSPPTPSPEAPEDEEEEPPETPEEADTNVQDVAQETDEEPFFTSIELIILTIIFFLIAVLALLVIGRLQNRKRARKKRQLR